MSSKSEETSGARLNALRALLTAARGLVDDLAGDPLVERIIRAFLMLPETVREPIVRVLERDASWRRIVDETEGMSGISVRPNPHASLYVHVFDKVTGQPVEPEPSPRDVSTIRLGIERFVALLPLFFQEGVHSQWRLSARELARAADPSIRALGRALAREVLALIDEVEAEERAASSSAG
jgi:hypothetical protein